MGISAIGKAIAKAARSRKKAADMTPEDREVVNRKAREKRAREKESLSEEEKASRRAAKAESQRRRRAALDQAGLAKKRAKDAEMARARRSKESPEQRDKRNAAKSNAANEKQRSESPEERIARLARHRELSAIREAAKSDSERAARNKRRVKLYRARNTPEARELKNQRRREIYANDPGKAIASVAAREAAKMQRTPAWADPGRIKEIYRTASEVSAETGIPHHVDHVMPLRGKNVSGLHHQDNLLIVPGADNLSKSNNFEPGDLPPRAGVRNARALLKKLKAAQEAARQ